MGRFLTRINVCVPTPNILNGEVWNVPGYKIVVDCDLPCLYLNKDMNSLGVDGYIWDKREKAENVVSAQQKSKNFTDDQKKHMRVVSVDDILEELKKKEEKNCMEEDVGQEDFVEIGKPSSDLVADPEEKNELFDAVTALADRLSGYNSRRLALRKAVSREDAVTLDLMHYIELTDEDDARQEEYAMLLRDSRIRRRRAKDMLKVLDALEGAAPAIISAAHWVKSTDKRSYHPRAIDPLPEGPAASGVLPGGDAVAGHMQPTQDGPADLPETGPEFDSESDSSLDAVSADTDTLIDNLVPDGANAFAISSLDTDPDAMDRGVAEEAQETSPSDDLDGRLVRFSIEFTEGYKKTHRPNKKGSWGALGEPDKVLGFARMAEAYMSAVLGGERSDEVVARLGRNPSEEKKYTQIARGTGFPGKVAKAWKTYRNRPAS